MGEVLLSASGVDGTQLEEGNWSFHVKMVLVCIVCCGSGPNCARPSGGGGGGRGKEDVAR